jgi:hypothetical protein
VAGGGGRRIGDSGRSTTARATPRDPGSWARAAGRRARATRLGPKANGEGDEDPRGGRTWGAGLERRGAGARKVEGRDAGKELLGRQGGKGQGPDKYTG